jgi:hypothetical protein
MCSWGGGRASGPGRRLTGMQAAAAAAAKAAEAADGGLN